jgi:hypothetical protein
MDLAQFKVAFDRLLMDYVQQKISDSKKILDNDTLNKILDYVQTFIFS